MNRIGMLIFLTTIWIEILYVNGEQLKVEENKGLLDQIRYLTERVKIIESRDHRQQWLINEMQRQLVKQTNEITFLKKWHAESTERKSMLLQILCENAAQSSSGNDLNMQSSEERAEAKETTKRGMKIERAEAEVTVAFTAGLSHTMEHLGPGQNIIFDHVETNIGNGYNPHQGAFTAPVDGTYVFFSTITTINNGRSQCIITVNGSHRASIHARGSNDDVDQGSKLVIVQLNRGDDVSVQNRYTDREAYGEGYIWSTFSGFLLQPGSSQTNGITG